MWILVLSILGYQSGAAITTIPNFETQQHCEVARQTWLKNQVNKFDPTWKKKAFTAVCIEVPNTINTINDLAGGSF